MVRLAPGYRIREVRAEDIDRVIEINRKVLPENYPRIFFLQHYSEFRPIFLVATDPRGDVVGYVMCRIETGYSFFERGKPVRKGHVISIGVLPEHRRKGVGYSLMLEAIKRMKMLYGVDEIYLEVRVSNYPAISLYRKLGFRVVDVIKGYYLDGEDAYLMARRSVEAYVVLVTAPKGECQRIVDHVIGQRLAACANVIEDIKSTFWWQGKIERGEECLIIFKTTVEAFEKLIEEIKRVHPYSVPEIIALPIEAGNKDYLRWVDEEVKVQEVE